MSTRELLKLNHKIACVQQKLPQSGLDPEVRSARRDAALVTAAFNLYCATAIVGYGILRFK